VEKGREGRGIGWKVTDWATNQGRQKGELGNGGIFSNTIWIRGGAGELRKMGKGKRECFITLESQREIGKKNSGFDLKECERGRKLDRSRKI